MGFSENLRNMRQEKNLSQEQLAEMLGVSRQSVSKWESDSGYPETEKLIQLAQKLDISLDALLLDKKPELGIDAAIPPSTVSFSGERKIAILTYGGEILSAFYKFTISPLLFSQKDEPKCILFGTDKSSFWGDNLVTVGWYATKEDARRELAEINKAMQRGEAAYSLKYFAKVKEKALGVKLAGEDDE